MKLMIREYGEASHTTSGMSHLYLLENWQITSVTRVNSYRTLWFESNMQKFLWVEKLFRTDCEGDSHTSTSFKKVNILYE